jgi:nitroreductase
MDFRNSITDIIKIRQSKRDYSAVPFNKELYEKIQTTLSKTNKGPFGNTIDFKLIEKTKAKDEHKVKLGTYGFISGARYFIAAGINIEKPYILEDYGFLMEKIILHMTGLGLGTCWLGGTFKRSEYSVILGNNKQLTVPAISPVGFPRKKKSIRDNLIRLGAKSNSRKPWNELFFNDSFDNPLSKADADSYTTPLEMLRRAPSASNKQPWRILKTEKAFHFFLCETPGYDKMIKAVKLQRIDMGIAMLHFEVTCKETNIKGKWEILKPRIEPSDAKYLVSWIIE